MGTPLAAPLKPDGSRYMSGTEWEFEDALHAGRDVLVYRRAAPAHPTGHREHHDGLCQPELVEQFFERFRNGDGSFRAGYWVYEHPAQFERRLLADIEALLNRWLVTETAHAREYAPFRTWLTESRMQAWLAWTAGAVGLFTITGCLNARSFEIGVGLAADAVGAAPPLSWPLWGLRAAVPPAVTWIALLVVVAITKATCRAVLPTHFTSAGIPYLKTLRPSTRAVSILIAHVTTLVFTCWYFAPLVGSLLRFAAGYAPTSELRPGNSSHGSYGYTLSVGLFVFTAAWYELLKSRRARRELCRRPQRILAISGAALLATNVLLVTFPHRTLYRNAREQVWYGPELCYLMTLRDDGGLLFCPMSATRHRTVSTTDRSFRRTGVIESIFAEL
jgi:hypothetical protein